MSEPNPRESDLILGGQNPPPVNAAVLGGLARAKQYLTSEWISLRLEVLRDVLHYGEDGINLAIQFLTDDAEEVRQLAYKLLCSRLGYVPLQNRLEEPQKNEFLRILASDCDAPPQLLVDLSASTDLLILKHLAGNHNTPSKILSILGNIGELDRILSQRIDDFEALNKAVDLNPFYYHTNDLRYGRTCRHNGRINLQEHYRRLAQQDISIEIIEIIKAACEIYQTIAKNPCVPDDVATTLGDFLTHDFIQNPVWYEHVKRNPLIIQQYCSLDMQIKMAENPNISAEGLQCLKNNCHKDVYKHIARNPNASAVILESIVASSIEHPVYPMDRPIYIDDTPVAIAENHNTPAHILEKLAKYREKITNESIKSALSIAIAQNANTPDQVLKYLERS
jgi:hypothetical protein